MTTEPIIFRCFDPKNLTTSGRLGQLDVRMSTCFKVESKGSGVPVSSRLATTNWLEKNANKKVLQDGKHQRPVFLFAIFCLNLQRCEMK